MNGLMGSRRGWRSRTHSHRAGVWAALLLCWLSCLSTSALARDVLVLSSAEEAPYLKLMAELQRTLSQKPSLRLESRTLGTGNSSRQSNADLVITLGSEALEHLLADPEHPPLLALMTPKARLERISRVHQEDVNQRRLGGVYLEQPYWRQLALARALLPEARRLGALLGPVRQRQAAELQSTFKALGWQPNLQPLDRDDNPLVSISRLVAASDVLLAIPDQADFNRLVARWQLLLSLREGVPLIGYSSRYVDAGALAAVYSSPASIAEEAADLVSAWLASPESALPPPRYPERFELRLNLGIADRLDISPPPASRLIERLNAREAP